jgi:competence protein ComEA
MIGSPAAFVRGPCATGEGILTYRPDGIKQLFPAAPCSYFLRRRSAITAIWKTAAAIGWNCNFREVAKPFSVAPIIPTGVVSMNKLATLFISMFFSFAAWAAGPVNINTATAEQIADSLKGVGLSKAEKIVEYRDTNGRFTHVDELVNVKGIGVRTVDINREKILLKDDNAQAAN